MLYENPHEIKEKIDNYKKELFIHIEGREDEAIIYLLLSAYENLRLNTNIFSTVLDLILELCQKEVQDERKKPSSSD